MSTALRGRGGGRGVGESKHRGRQEEKRRSYPDSARGVGGSGVSSNAAGEVDTTGVRTMPRAHAAGQDGKAETAAATALGGGGGDGSGAGSRSPPSSERAPSKAANPHTGDEQRRARRPLSKLPPTPPPSLHSQDSRRHPSPHRYHSLSVYRASCISSATPLPLGTRGVARARRRRCMSRSRRRRPGRFCRRPTIPSTGNHGHHGGDHPSEKHVAAKGWHRGGRRGQRGGCLRGKDVSAKKGCITKKRGEGVEVLAAPS